ncbi:MAG: LysR family transcriptional regulator [Negativicutes bacterium]|nr:LysR family transcriptional regulator [Negativicutes bacterium]
MEIRQLKTFALIARLGSFVQAADTLGYAQSTVTSHIQTLESELGVRLFERLGHRIKLTDPGKSLLPYAEQVIKLTAEALEAITKPDVPQGKLTIGTGESLGTYRLPALLQAYRNACPGVEIILKFANCSTIDEYIRNNEIDVGLIINNRVGGNDLVVETISAEPMLFLVSPEHPLAQKEKVGPADLAETCVILTEPGCSYRLTMEKILKDSRTAAPSFLEASSIETIKQLVMLGFGLSMLPSFAVEKELADGRIRSVRWDGPIPDYTVQLLYHKDKWLSPALREFLRIVRCS